MDDWIEVFKTGEHTDSAGNTRQWTQADLDKIVEQSSSIEAPAVIGHPRSDSPAWGWIEGVKTASGSLFVKFKDIIPEFSKMVKNKMFPNRSIALNSDLSIRHIGFLGAAAPAVKGLEGIKFNEKEAIVIEFMDKKEDDIEKGENMKDKEKDMDKKISFSEKELEDKLKAQALEFTKLSDARDLRILELEGEAEKSKKELLKAEIKTFCEKLKGEGKLLPAWEKMGLNEFMCGLSSEGSFEFSSGNKETPISFFQRFLSALPKVVEFEEIAKYEKSMNEQTFKTAGDFPVDEDSLEIHNKVLAYQKQNKGVSYVDAIAEISQ